MNDVTLPQLQSALDDLIAETFGVPLADDDLTVQRLAEKVGCTWDTAKRTLKKWETAGKVEYTGERRSAGGRLLDAWRDEVKQNPPSCFNNCGGLGWQRQNLEHEYSTFYNL